MSDKLRKVLTVLLLIVFTVSTGLTIRHGADSVEGEESYGLAQQIAAQSKETEEEPVALAENATQETQPWEQKPTETEPEKPQTVWVPMLVKPDEPMQQLADINLEALRKINPDVVGWIMIPNTKINYPVVHGENNQHYLSHTWDNQKNSAGSIFMEENNDPDFKDFRTIIYGHNMANSTMFGSLHQYRNRAYWEKNPYVYLVTDEGVLRYEIYASYMAEVAGKTYALDIDDRLKASFIQMTLDESEWDADIQPAVTDRILTLSTCAGNYDYRRVVHARLAMMEVEVKENSLQEIILQ